MPGASAPVPIQIHAIVLLRVAGAFRRSRPSARSAAERVAGEPGAAGYVIANGRYVASTKNIERNIRNLEGFAVRIRNDVKRRNLPDYDYGRAARAAFTVADWKRARFERNYPDLDVDVLRADGRTASATVTLAKLRSDYE
jgi:hypothetical protein